MLNSEHCPYNHRTATKRTVLPLKVSFPEKFDVTFRSMVIFKDELYIFNYHIHLHVVLVIQFSGF